ncbi:MAG: pimelyl-ACP methyl ester esterase BioV [Sulfuricurvum sp.]
MIYFNGFALKGEEKFFTHIVDGSDFSVVGFSYGAKRAKEFVMKQLAKGMRVDRLMLISPLFFQMHDKKFKRLQLLGYTKEADLYISNFLSNCFEPYEMRSVDLADHSKDELEELLFFEWSVSELKSIADAGVIIEVYLGERDAITPALEAYEFFRSVATVTLIKGANHFLLKE